MAPRIRVGTSGWVYRDWREEVYPEGLAQRRWLEHLSRRFPTIELNASFYRLPERATFGRWGAQVPSRFVFAVKMSRFLTHVRRLRDPGDALERFWKQATGLGDSLGPVLFQQPPTLACDVGVLRELLSMLPDGMRAAFEFRHDSWFRDDVLELLDEAGAAWVLADRPGARVALDVTGGWSYVRFHQGTRLGSDYRASKLRRWADRLLVLEAREVFVYFNNDPGGAAVRDAERLMRLLGASAIRVEEFDAASPRGSSARAVARGAAPAGGRGRAMDAVTLLKQDHEKVKKLLSDLESTTERAEKTRTEGLATLKQELEVHEVIEEEIFYPALKEHPKTKEIALEAYEEHHVVDMVVGEIEGIEPSDETWMAKFTVLKENLEHHIEEEESEMFKQAKQVFDDAELDDLGARMQERKDQLKAQAA